MWKSALAVCVETGLCNTREKSEGIVTQKIVNEEKLLSVTQETHLQYMTS